MGATLDELMEAYGEPAEVRYGGPSWIEYSYYDGYVVARFYCDPEEKQVTTISLGIVSSRSAYFIPDYPAGQGKKLFYKKSVSFRQWRFKTGVYG